MTLTLLTAGGCSKTSSKSISFKPGTYTSTQQGLAGNFDVAVTFSDHAIDSINVGANNETKMVGSEALRILPDRIIKNQSLNVDVVSGATTTSNAVIAGVKDCVEQAQGNLDALSSVPLTTAIYENYANLPREADVIVVGGGLAGITAAISAKQNGSNVILLEEKEYLGGNSALSTGVTLLGGGTSIQKAAGIQDDPDSFNKWILENSDNQKDPVQTGWIAYHSQELIDWFAKMGVNFDKKVNVTDESPVNRAHNITPNMATAITSLRDYMESIGVDVRYSTKAESIITNAAGEVTGVNATNFSGDPVKYTGKKIILATGGFGENIDMVAKNWGAEYGTLVYGGAKGMDGALLNNAVALGAATVDMDKPHIDATLEISRGITITTNLLRDCGGVLIRQSTGQRFTDEQASHSEVAAAKMRELGDQYYYEIFDNNAFTTTTATTTKAKSYINMGIATKYDSIDQMAIGLGVDANALKQTLEEFNSEVRGETKDRFGRQGFYKELAAPYYVMKVSNGVACTIGGLKTNEKMQVVNTNGKPIPNLYAIGEITGGYLVHYVAGDSLARSAISGMLLGIELKAN
jgi:Succinate dehydrogenase/fumarate reductase, flavoprotein subunit